MKRIWLIVLGIIISTDSLIAQENVKTNSLFGHQFSSFEIMKNPFLNTNMYLELGTGESGVFTTDRVPVGDTTIFNLSGELLFIELKLGYEQRVKNWLTFFFNYGFSARLGDGVESLVTAGVSQLSTTELGIAFRLSKGEKHILTSYLKITNTQATIIDVKAYVADLILGNKNASVSKDVPSLNSGVGLIFSYAFHPLVGFNFDGQLVHGETLRRGGNEYQYFVGTNLDFSLKDVTGFPLSIVVGGYANTLTNVFSTQGNLTSTFVSKLVYTGSDSFSIGLEVYRGLTPIENTDRRVELEGVRFNSHFYF